MRPRQTRRIAGRAFALILLCVATTAGAILPDPLVETRYAGAPRRDAKGQIIRRADTLAAFRKVHPCPATMAFTGACPGWSIDHVISLACGGADAVWNMQWLPNGIKTAPGIGKDRWERSIYAFTPPYPDTGACINKVIP